MAGCMVETSWPTSEEAYSLGRAVGDKMAWAYVIKLWCWGIDADKADGQAALDPERFADICGWEGDAFVWFSECVRHAVITPVPRRRGIYYIRGWSRNRRFFAEKSRLRRINEARRVARVHHADATQNALGNPSLYPSPLQNTNTGGTRAKNGAAPKSGNGDDSVTRNEAARALAEETAARAKARAEADGPPTPPEKALAKIRAIAAKAKKHAQADIAAAEKRGDQDLTGSVPG